MQTTEIQLPATPSLLHSNIAISDKHLAFVNNVKPHPQVHLIGLETFQNPGSKKYELCKYKDEQEILHVNYLYAKKNWHLILGSFRVLQVWSHNGSKLLAHVAAEDFRYPSPELAYFSASCAVQSENLILAGSSLGYIHVIRREDEKSGSSFNVEEFAQGPTSDSISAMTCTGSSLIVGDEEGVVSLWSVSPRIAYQRSDYPQGVPVTSAQSKDTRAYIAFGNGMIRIYSTDSLDKLFDIWAHSRWITSLAVHPTRPYIVSGGEDGCVNVWRVESEVSSHSSQIINNRSVTAVGFAGNANNAVVALCYDDRSLYVMGLIS